MGRSASAEVGKNTCLPERERERLAHIDRYGQNILARIARGNPFSLIPHCAFSFGTLVSFDPCVSSAQCRTGGGLSQASHSACVYRTIVSTSSSRLPDSFTRVLEDASAGQGAAANSKAKTAMLSRAHNSIGNSVESKPFCLNLSLHGVAWSSRVAISHGAEQDAAAFISHPNPND